MKTIATESRRPEAYLKKKVLVNKFYIKYYSIQAGNNNPKLKEDKDKLIAQLERLAM